LTDTHTAGVATALALCLTANRVATGSKSGKNEDHNTRTHINLVTNLVMSEPDDYRILII
jgi:hypothetical protein